MQDYDLCRAVWRKSSRSNGNGGACIEVTLTGEVVGVRDSKNRDGGTLLFAPDQWHTFLRNLDNAS
ncbi:DUF397 domain-containing protein [Saccharopolyspora phatthalungensis]|uniref:DUF397 domain-containing protein n=1 Tax=Saccharopolyspora phatthalungensis TaxID=664693 RepID=UPI00160BF589|nr:DUF397 domain-containing protein [Saccharopolyspora phatthalungensis]